MSFSSTNKRCKQTNFFPFKFFENRKHDFFFAKFHHLFAGIVTICFANSGVKQTKEIVNFCNRTNSTSWIFVGCFLFYRNYRRKSSDFIYIRPFHISNKLTGISGEAFHVAALSFIVYCIKCQR